jgi:hypothetical protein
MTQDTMSPPQTAIAVLMSFILVLTTIPFDANAQSSSQSTSEPTGQGEEYAPLTPDELDGLVAPIALYPDALVAQVLGAATFPYEVVDAVVWLKQNANLSGDLLMKAVDQQSWDPAVKALTQFPSVLDNLAKNLAWTSSLGEASATQQQDVMIAIQRMRAKAYAAGNLKSSPEIKVVQESPHRKRLTNSPLDSAGLLSFEIPLKTALSNRGAVGTDAGSASRVLSQILEVVGRQA